MAIPTPRSESRRLNITFPVTPATHSVKGYMAVTPAEQSTTRRLFMSRNNGVDNPTAGISSGIKTMIIKTWRILNLKRAKAQAAETAIRRDTSPTVIDNKALFLSRVMKSTGFAVGLLNTSLKATREISLGNNSSLLGRTPVELSDRVMIYMMGNITSIVIKMQRS